MGRWVDHPASAWVLASVALVIAAAGARPFAGGWNDGSRLATVESIIDRGTLAMDDSVFCGTPQKRLIEDGHLPYSADEPGLNLLGTRDKLFVRGRFYSDKPAVSSILLAGLYRPLMWLEAPSPGERPDVFAWIVTVLSSGLGYAAAIGCMWAVGRRVGLPPGWRSVWLASLAFSTFALTYTRHVNAHTMQLGALAGMCLLFLRIAEASATGRTAWGSILGLGTLAGFGFNLDFGSGPPLASAAFVAVAWRARRVGPVAAFSLAMLPWVAAGVGINYAIGGVWLPMNMYPEHLDWPGSPFSPENMTGFSRHEPLNLFLYAAGMWFGKHGFLNHNLPTLLLLAAGWGAIRRAGLGRIELIALLGWCAASWLEYAVLSNNMGGACCSVRWFLPFLAPLYWMLAIALRDDPRRRAGFVVLSAGGMVLAAIMWSAGPWSGSVVPMLWPVVGATLIAWSFVARRSRPLPTRAVEWVRVRILPRRLPGVKPVAAVAAK